MQDRFLPYSEFVGILSEPFGACVVRDMKVNCMSCLNDLPFTLNFALPGMCGSRTHYILLITT